ncbi:MAG: Imm52 family immunity protein [Beijerinckiaceae bacterium]
MSASLNYIIAAHWGRRLETPTALAERVRCLIRRFEAIDPVLAHWYEWLSETRVVPLDLSSVSLSKRIAATVYYREDGTPLYNFGYHFVVSNNNKNKWGPRGFTLTIHAGADARPNFLTLDTDYGFVPDPDIITYAIFKAAILAVAECFDAIYCDAYPADLAVLWPDGGRRTRALVLAWMIYISPRFAHLITPPPTAIVEYRPNGGLFMAATDETFVTANPKHLAVARDIEAAIAPLNALPWPPDAEPE